MIIKDINSTIAKIKNGTKRAGLFLKDFAVVLYTFFIEGNSVFEELIYAYFWSVAFFQHQKKRC